MSRQKNKNITIPPREKNPIVIDTSYLDSRLRFNFKFLQDKDKDFNIRKCSKKYYVSLMERLKVYSDYAEEQLENILKKPERDSTRYHKIDWEEDNVIRSTFGLPPLSANVDPDRRARQLSAGSQRGRFQFFLYRNTIFVVWLDPDHKLYPGKRR
ncbi:MAG: hypothetical protein E3J72_17025 [Planctomycetota bacterium]|nr:MAG: hypothetical protein E3J72_17025 [Planctomycetota bacterium]